MTAPRTTTPEPMRSRRRSPIWRKASLPSTSARAASTRSPLTSMARSRRSPARAAASWPAQPLVLSFQAAHALLQRVDLLRHVGPGRAQGLPLSSSTRCWVSMRSMAASPVKASMRRTPAATLPSETIRKGPMSPVRAHVRAAAQLLRETGDRRPRARCRRTSRRRAPWRRSATASLYGLISVVTGVLRAISWLTISATRLQLARRRPPPAT